MSNMKNFLFDIEEVVNPLIYMGATDETIMEEVKKVFANNPNYIFILQTVETRLRNRDFGNADLYV